MVDEAKKALKQAKQKAKKLAKHKAHKKAVKAKKAVKEAKLKLQAKLVQKYFPDNIDNIPKVGVVEPAMTQQAEDEAKIIAAITAAITDHRKN